MIENRDSLEHTPERDLALSCLEVGVAASDPERVLDRAMDVTDDILTVEGDRHDLSEYDEILVVGGGKASGPQAQALEALLGDRIDRGIVITNDPLELKHITVAEGDHPVPSPRGVEATEELLDIVREAGDRTLVIVLVSGGGSALLPAPADPVTLDDLREVTETLLESGATIQEINALRKHLSAIKGGGLARTAAPAQVVTVLMSDVVGDDPSVIASGPTVPDESTFADAQAVLDRYGIDPPERVTDRLAAGLAGDIAETPGPEDELFDRVETHLIADGGTPLRTVASFLSDRPETPLVLSSRIRGEAREAAKTHVAIGEEILASGNPVAPPAVLLSGGETTVTVRGDGTGGPNQEFALSAAIERAPGLTIAAMDTDGIDGTGPAAGGIVDADTVEEQALARNALEANDAYPYLRDRDGAIETGPTGTNVNDFRVIVVESPDP